MARPRKETGKPVPGFSREFEKRIETLISKVGGHDAAASAIGASYSQLTSWKFGRSRPDFFALSQLCDVAGFSVDWLATGRDSSPPLIQIEAGTQREQAPLPMLQTIDASGAEQLGLVMVPRLDVQASAGLGREPTGEQPLGFLAFQEVYLRYLGINPFYARVIQVSGLSMYPTLNHEDLVIVDTSIDEVRDEALYAVIYGGLVLIKRVRISRDGSVTLSSDNKAEGYTDETIKPSDLAELHIAGRVCGRVARM